MKICLAVNQEVPDLGGISVEGSSWCNLSRILILFNRKFARTKGMANPYARFATGDRRVCDDFGPSETILPV